MSLHKKALRPPIPMKLRRRPGPPPLDPAVKLENVTIRLTAAQLEVKRRLGDAAIRAWLDSQA